MQFLKGHCKSDCCLMIVFMFMLLRTMTRYHDYWSYIIQLFDHAKLNGVWKVKPKVMSLLLSFSLWMLLRSGLSRIETLCLNNSGGRFTFWVPCISFTTPTPLGFIHIFQDLSWYWGCELNIIFTTRLILEKLQSWNHQQYWVCCDSHVLDRD